MKTPFPVAANLSVQQLREEFSHAAGLAEKLSGVACGVNDGNICSIRRLELGLMEAGMVRPRLPSLDYVRAVTYGVVIRTA